MDDNQPMRTAAIIGGGPAGLMAAEALAAVPALRVTVYEGMPTLGRKFLMAGRGGLNLTHSEAFGAFMARYGAAETFLQPLIETFPPAALRTWAEELGQPTFIGSSGRVFPEAMKASGLLRAWLRRLFAAGVAFETRHRWTGWTDDGTLAFETPGGLRCVSADVAVLALGGASWPRLGADGGWVPILEAQGIDVRPLGPSNCGVLVSWSSHFIGRFDGAPLKSIAIVHHGNRVRGEAVVTRTGLEGGAVYAISGAIRNALRNNGTTTITVDLKPDVDLDTLTRQLGRPRRKQSLATFLRKSANLSPVSIGLLQEIAHTQSLDLSNVAGDSLAARIKSLPLAITGTGGLDRAISTAGGIPFDALDENLMLRARPGVFVAGEMLDWEAPTGGYLLQACFATGHAAGCGARRWLDSAVASPRT
ncbi:MAG: putative signal peptide, flavoprotein [Pseudomonadota bacterium]|jgi:uncharacterized flavoprotein (TIGR03862 family)